VSDIISVLTRVMSVQNANATKSSIARIRWAKFVATGMGLTRRNFASHSALLDFETAQAPVRRRERIANTTQAPAGRAGLPFVRSTGGCPSPDPAHLNFCPGNSGC